MNSLGLSQLTDDQLVELLSEVCAEAVQRDPYVRKASQNAIDAQAKELEIIRKAAKQTIRKQEQKLRDLEDALTIAINRTTIEYRQQLETDVFQMVRQEIADGTFRPMKPTEEAIIIVNSVQKANDAALKNIPPEVFDASRKTVMDNLRRMGHSVEDIERLYGKF